MASKKSPGCGTLLLCMVGLFLLIALPGWLLSPDPPAPPPESALQRKVREDLHREQAAQERAVQESLERIRQSH